jgi:hypothetical protein
VVSGAVTTNKATISSIQTFMQGNLDLGVTSVGITFGTSGTDINASGSPVTSSGNITINLPTASATNRGALSSADWITFNSKQPAGNYVTLDTVQTITAQKTFTTSGSSDTMIISHGSGSGFALDVIKAGNNEAIRVTKTSGSGNAMTVIGGNFEAPTIVKTGGTSSQFLKADGSIDSTAYTTNTGTVTSVGLSSATSGVTIGSTPITTSGTITLAIATASGSQNGLLSSTDWTTFNGKQNALTNPITGTGATGQVAYWTGTNSQTGSNNLFWDNANVKLGIGTNTPEGTGLTVAGGGVLISLDSGAARKVLELYATSTGAKLSSSYVGASSYGNLELLTSGLARLTIADTGGVTLTGALNGTSATFAINNASVGNATNLNLQQAGSGDVAVSYLLTGAREWLVGVDNSDSDTFKINNITGSSDFNNLGLSITTTGNVGIGTANPSSKLTILKTITTNPGATGNAALSLGTAGSTGEYNLINFGYDAGTWQPAYMGYLATSGAGSSNGALVFATRDLTTDSQPTERMRITSAGNVGIGTASPANGLSSSRTLNIYGGASTGGEIVIEGNSGGNFLSLNAGTSSGDLPIVLFNRGLRLGHATSKDATGFVESMRITSGGDVLVNETSASSQGERFAVTDTNLAAMFKTTGGAANNWAANFWNNATSGNNLFIEFGTETAYAGRGSVTYNRGSGVVAYNTISDYRIKTEIEDFNALEIVSNLKPKEFKIGDAEQKSIGFIAHELQEFFPQAVHGEKDAEDENQKPIYQGVDYSQLTGLLTKAIQELKTEIDSLKNQIK